MTRDDLVAHLEYFQELGVEGLRADPVWRARAVADERPAPAADPLAEQAAERAADPAAEHETEPAAEEPETPTPTMSAPSTPPSPVPAVSPASSAPSVAASATEIVPVYGSSAEALLAIRHDIGEQCSRCKLHQLGRKQIVFGVGNPHAKLMFVGEAPGADEDIQGEPFVGRAGQLLTKIIEAIGLTREDVYIANVIKCRPPQNRNPEPDEVEQCEPFLFRQIDTIKPAVIVALGKFAAQSLLRTAEPITRIRGREFAYRGSVLMPTYHPAYLLRNPSAKRDVWEDMKRVRQILDA